MKKPTRSEQEVFADLAALCCRPGYVHALAQLCFRDNVILFASTMKEKDMQKMFSPSRLIRTEINTLLGLLVKADIDWTRPPSKTIQEYIDASERLLEELHNCLSAEFFSGLSKEAVEKGTFNPFESGRVLREPIFYGGEAAYNFQYIDLAARKYAADATWLQANRGFTIDQASRVARAIEDVHAEHFYALREHLRKLHPDQLTILPVFIFSPNEITAKTNLPTEVVERVLCAFELSSGDRNTNFNALHDFNVVTATPLLRTPDGQFLSLQSYSLAEAIYEAPFYWMAQDKPYFPTSTKNRGEFTEDFVAERLSLVFGVGNVHLNVDIFETKDKKTSEIDILVIWGNRVIVVQAKSKRLTLEARKGNDQVIRDDFKKAVQTAYDQGLLCAQCLLDKGYRVQTNDGRQITLPELKEVYLFCVVSDHYPALSFQARQFLKTKNVDRVQPPLITDIFTIDALTEMLQTPLQFLSYINRRVNYTGQLMASQELTILGYHLKKNLWVDPDVGLMQLHDDFTAGLDIAMAARRAGVQGPVTPDGVLTRFRNTTIGRLVQEIETRPEPSTVDLGFLLLAMSEQAVDEMSRAVDRIAARTRADGRVHDATFGFKEGVGITFHCTDEPVSVAGPRLESYCEGRKYKEKAGEWFGVCMSSMGPTVRFGISLAYPWRPDPRMDVTTRDMKDAMQIDQALAALFSGAKRTTKTGRNDHCPCGSGRKYKKCCLG